MSEVSRWHMHRLGLVDFWYYVNEEFYFKNGHMLLRGSNGSGKSVTLQSFIPLILDGNKSSERLDPFGTRSRKIENYLLEEGSERDQRIAYLYLEFKREDSPIYKTIGMGLYAKKGRPVDSWYFVIEDNKRINRDILLMQKDIAITKQQLKNMIGEQYIDSQSAYMEKVNQSLFGFESVDNYKEAISLLLKLRTPKLSNSLKPTMINEILSESLQPLSEDDLRPMSEAISNMDSIQDILDSLNTSYQAAKNIYHRYEAYNYDCLTNKYEKYEYELNEKNQLEIKIHQMEQSIQTYQIEIKDKEEEQANYEQEQLVLNEEKNSLLDQDLKRLNDDVNQLQNEMSEMETQIHVKKGLLAKKEDQFQQINRDLQNKLDDCELSQLSIKEEIEELNVLYQDNDFSEHLVLKENAWKHLEDGYNYQYAIQCAEKEIQLLNSGITHFHNQQVVKNNMNHIFDEKEELENEKQVKERNLEQTFHSLEQEKEVVLEKVMQWQSINQVFKLDEDESSIMVECIQDYEDDPEMLKMKQMIMDHYQKAYQNLLLEKNREEQKLQSTYQEMDEKEKTMIYWQDLKDPKPECSTDQINHRKQLEAKQVAFIPFYKTIEFDEQMSESMKNRIEEILAESGLLNAIIINKKDMGSFDENLAYADQYLIVTKEIAALASYTITGDSIKDVQISLHNIFKDLGMDVNALLKIDEKLYQHGLLHGSVSGKVQSVFIGGKAREAYRLKMLMQSKDEYEIMKNEYLKQQTRCAEIENRCNLLVVEKDSLPQFSKLHDIYLRIDHLQQQLPYLLQSIQHVEERIEKVTVQLKEINQSLRKMCDELSLPMDKERFIKQKDSLEEYIKSLHKIDNLHQRYVNMNELYETLNNQKEVYNDDIIQLNDEIFRLHSKMKASITMLENKQRQLEEKGYDKIKVRMDYINSRLNELPDLIKGCISQSSTMRAQIDGLNKDVIDDKNKLNTQIEIVTRYYQTLIAEIKLYYVVEKETLENDEMLLKRAKDKINLYKWNYKRDKIATDFQESFYSNRANLQEYNLTLTSILSTDGLSDIKERLDIIAKHAGKRLQFIELMEKLERDIELQKTLLVNQDRELYEDILVNTISKKIRNRIRNSHKWVIDMNRYMDSMNTSSGLKLNLSWKAKKAENEEEMDTREVVDLLEKDVNVLKEKDLQRLSLHFRSKIEVARTLRDEEDNTLSFHHLIKDVMDYRKWFEFRILSQKTGEAKKELTNNTFHAFSGGEKAMSMYVPLFSAVAAKFASAKEDTPMLIALDEAFAGVDEKNIDNMFALIGKFKFDYIMNSQVLWGDYPSVSALAIYELFRPENAKYVTVIAYEWNGVVKRMKA